jgi:hypothetical protein
LLFTKQNGIQQHRYLWEGIPANQSPPMKLCDRFKAKMNQRRVDCVGHPCFAGVIGLLLLGFIGVAGFFFQPRSAHAQGAPSIATSEPTVTYFAREGDTLIGLGQRLLIRPGDWQPVQRLNGIKNPHAIPVGTAIRIPISMLRATDAPGKVVNVSGIATLDGVPVQEGADVKAGARLATAQGAITVALADGSQLTLQPQSEVAIARAHRYGTLGVFDSLIELLFGRVETRVNPQRRNDRYEIHSPSAALGVRGTVFRVGNERGSKATTSEVIEGKVLATATGTNANASTHASVNVDAGFGTKVEAGKAPLPPVRLLPAPAVDRLPARYERLLVRIPVPEVTGASRYRAQIARDPTFQSLVEDAVAQSGEFRFANLADGRYSLRLRAIDTNGIEGSDALHTFELKARPEPPILAQPAEGAKVLAGTVQLRWSQPVSATRYRVQVASDAAFTQRLLDVSDEDMNQLEWANAAPGRYYWRVATNVGSDAGPFGDAQSFEARAGTAALPPAKDVGDAFAFSVTGQPGQTFAFQLAADPDFKMVVTESSHQETDVRLPKPAAGDYYVRYRSIDPDGFTGPYSAPQKVVVEGRPWYLLLLALLILI